MKKITTINDRISYIVNNQFNGNKKKFAESIGFAAQVVSNIVSGRRSKPSFDVINAMLSTNDDLSAKWLITGKGNIYETKNDLATISKIVESKVPQVITVDRQNKDNIVLVPQKAQAGYLEGYNNPAFIEELPSYRLPNVDNGIYRMFQVAGFSMLPTLHDKSIVVGQFIENWLTDILDNRVYVVATEEHGVVVKRCLNRIEKYGNLFCKSDNRREYPSFSVAPNKIKEIWEVKLALTYSLPDPADLFDRVNDLEAELYNLKGLLKEDNKQKNIQNKLIN